MTKHTPHPAAPVEAPAAAPESEQELGRRPRNWWFSADGRRGFCWNSVVGYHYNMPGAMGYVTATLSLYTQGGIVYLTAEEAVKVYELVKEKLVKHL